MFGQPHLTSSITWGWGQGEMGHHFSKMASELAHILLSPSQPLERATQENLDVEVGYFLRTPSTLLSGAQSDC